MLPKVARIGALEPVQPSARAEWREIEAAPCTGIESQVLDTRTVADIERAFVRRRASMPMRLVVGSGHDHANQSKNSWSNSRRSPAAGDLHIPGILWERAGPGVPRGEPPDLYRRAAASVDKILKRAAARSPGRAGDRIRAGRQWQGRQGRSASSFRQFPRPCRGYRVCSAGGSKKQKPARVTARARSDPPTSRSADRKRPTRRGARRPLASFFRASVGTRAVVPVSTMAPNNRSSSGRGRRSDARDSPTPETAPDHRGPRRSTGDRCDRIGELQIAHRKRRVYAPVGQNQQADLDRGCALAASPHHGCSGDGGTIRAAVSGARMG